MKRENCLKRLTKGAYMDCWLMVDLKYNFECDSLHELSNNKLTDNNLASELVENRSFFKQSQSMKL